MVLFGEVGSRPQCYGDAKWIWVRVEFSCFYPSDPCNEYLVCWLVSYGRQILQGRRSGCIHKSSFIRL
jgi:hypothetical protein